MSECAEGSDMLEKEGCGSVTSRNLILGDREELRKWPGGVWRVTGGP